MTYRERAQEIVRSALAAELHCGTEDCEEMDDWAEVVTLVAAGLEAADGS